MTNGNGKNPASEFSGKEETETKYPHVIMVKATEDLSDIQMVLKFEYEGVIYEVADPIAYAMISQLIEGIRRNQLTTEVLGGMLSPSVRQVNSISGQETQISLIDVIAQRVTQAVMGVLQGRSGDKKIIDITKLN